MFTGLIEAQGTIEAMTRRGDGVRVVLRAEAVVEELSVGGSLSVDGVCLTAVEVTKTSVAVDLSAETLRRTTLGSKKVGERCNLELPVRLGARMGGHLVTGHIDGVGVVAEVRPEAGSRWVTIEAPPEVMRYIVPKGSVAVDGISMTVAAHTARSFSMAVIPHTAEVTTLGVARVGTTVNLEADIIGKYVERFVAERAGEEAAGLTREFLVKHGFAK
ncbi:MAG: riboflavin synthase [Nitrospinota bacterium]